MATSERAPVDLSGMARDFAVATAEGATDAGHKPLSAFLSRVRQALGMDIAFVCRFAEDRLIYQVVSAAADGPSAVAPGNSDPLVDSYCKRIVEGRLPRFIPDSNALDETRSLPITQRLDIGAYLSVPILLQDGRVFGTICCFSHDPKPELSRDDADALQDVANAIAAGVDRSGQLRGDIWMG